MAKPGVRAREPHVVTPRAEATKVKLIDAAIAVVREQGFTGASSRAIGERAGCNQALVFYHFDSVNGLLLAALDAVSQRRATSYDALIADVVTPVDLVHMAIRIFTEDLELGHTKFLIEMIAGSSSSPMLGHEVAARIAPWTDFARRAIETSMAGSPLGSLADPKSVAYAVVALFLGLEMLTHLEGDATTTLQLFESALHVAQLFQPADALSSQPDTDFS